ncbi:MAG: hypothetical protein KGL35_24180 [Bradyrhizobium sp.]|nr:hypothetical protein [Bradyrhizobium sp.]
MTTYSLSFNFGSIAEMQAFAAQVASLANASATILAAPAAVPAPAIHAAPPVPAAAPVANIPAPPPAAPAAPPIVEQKTRGEAPPGWLVSHIVDACRAHVQQFGAEGAASLKALNARFGVERATDIDPARWPEFHQLATSGQKFN